MTAGQAELAPERRDAPASETQLALSVVVPVFNQADSIADNIEIIRQCLQESLGDAFELIVVSDGSIDETEERMLEARAENVRTIHYDRNLGKGYAVKIGALEAQGRWIAFMDADLDLHPSRLPDFLRVRGGRAARLRDRLEAPPGVRRLLSALASSSELALPAARARSSSGSTFATRR